ncbi:hypothetical protein C5L23_001341 [Leuconostoc fallax]|uniref:Uncharacterized protein n=1 Tax=Leuconostoc fallax TaxID=1251 RepID=A0A4R5N7M9_9LACO|nr:hypothetical protein C5L23_001341 [Leuconostoc fallax]
MSKRVRQKCVSLFICVSLIQRTTDRNKVSGLQEYLCLSYSSSIIMVLESGFNEQHGGISLEIM